MTRDDDDAERSDAGSGAMTRDDDAWGSPPACGGRRI